MRISTVSIASIYVMKKMSSATTPSGFLGVFHIPKEKAGRALKPGIVLFNISDPGNMGTLIRTTVALNAACVIVEGCDPWSPKVVQASAGMLASAYLIELSWAEVKARKHGLMLCALVVTGGQSPDTCDMNNVLWVLGNEAHGLPEAIVEHCDQRITIPMPGPAESLNAAIAGSIALYLRYEKTINK